MSDRADPQQTRLTAWEGASIRRLRKKAGRADGEPLQPEDWVIAMHLHEHGMGRGMAWLLRTLPSGPRCGICGAPFAGVGSRLASPLGYRPSRKNPHICSVCVEFSPPGGITMFTGVLFADLRSFTARFEDRDPMEAAAVLRRFYRSAEDVLFPDAVIDKVIGDEVMALYLPDLTRRFDREAVPALMLDHARELLREVGYGSDEEPFVTMGIGIDVGEAYVGNIGQRALYDFTAVGDVVNTASRLQGQAASGEIVLSERAAAGLPDLPGTRVELTLKGKAEPQPAYRLRV